jgi:transcriptional regulator with XRE-family HTH domain
MENPSGQWAARPRKRPAANYSSADNHFPNPGPNSPDHVDDSITLRISTNAGCAQTPFPPATDVQHLCRVCCHRRPIRKWTSRQVPAESEAAVQRCERIRVARRRSAFSQTQLGQRLGVQRSAVANWESGAASPSSQHLEQLACTLEVAHEWLATGRGEMALPEHCHAGLAVDRGPVDNSFETRLLRAWRRLPTKLRLALLELLEAYGGRRRGS